MNKTVHFINVIKTNMVICFLLDSKKPEMTHKIISQLKGGFNLGDN